MRYNNKICCKYLISYNIEYVTYCNLSNGLLLRINIYEWLYSDLFTVFIHFLIIYSVLAVNIYCVQLFSS